MSFSVLSVLLIFLWIGGNPEVGATILQSTHSTHQDKKQQQTIVKQDNESSRKSSSTTTATATTSIPRVHKHTLPTLLQVVDPLSGEYVTALDNPLYDQFNQAVIAATPREIQQHQQQHQTREQSTVLLPKLGLDKMELTQIRDSLTISWEEVQSIVDPNDILVLYCREHRNNNNLHPPPSLLLKSNTLEEKPSKLRVGRTKNDNDEKVVPTDNDKLQSDWVWQKSDMLEVATIAQARATNTRHYFQKGSSTATTSTNAVSSEDYWFLPHFPVTRHDVCEFILYHLSSEEVIIEKLQQQQQHIANGKVHGTNLSTSSITFGATSSNNNNTKASRSLQTKPSSLASPPLLPKEHTHWEPIATSGHISLLRLKDIPTQLHLALGNTPTTMVAQFTTASQGKPVGMYYEGRNNKKDGKKVEGASHTYTASDMCGAPANLTQAGAFQSPGMLHVLEMTGLKPDKEYTYKVGLASGQGIVWSDLYTFTSPPVIGGGGGEDDSDSDSAPPKPYSYVVYGDQGCPSVGWGQGGAWVEGMLERETKTTPSNVTGSTSIRSIHHFGDLSYARGASHIWDEWFVMMAPVASKVPLMIGVGNHEYDHISGGENGKDPSGVTTPHGFMPRWGNMGDDSSGECGVPTSQRFQMPQSSHHHSSNGVFWYSYDFATTHTIVLSSEHDLSHGSPQYAWLVDNMELINRTITPWLVVELHRPLYDGEMFWSDTAVGIGMRMEFEHLLYDYQVDVVFAGHYHSYFRTCDGLFRSKCNHHHGPTHITIGTAGASLDDSPVYKTHWMRKHIVNQYGYGRVTVMNATTLHFEFVKAGPVDDDTAGTVMDDVWIVRQRR